MTPINSSPLEQQCPLDWVPDEILLKNILYQLDPLSLIRLGCVSKFFHQMVQEKSLWKRLYQECNLFPSPDKKNIKELVIQNVRFRDAALKGKLRCIQTLAGHSHPVTHLCFAGEKILSSTSKDTSIRVWRYVKKQKAFICVSELEKHSNSIVTKIFYSNSKKMLFSGFCDSEIQVWRDRKKKGFEPLQTLKGHSASITCFSEREGMFFSGSDDQTIKVWEFLVAEQQFVCSHTVHPETPFPSQVTSLFYAPEFQILFSSPPPFSSGIINYTQIKLWKWNSFNKELECVDTIERQSTIVSVFYSKKTLFLVRLDKNIDVFKPTIGESKVEWTCERTIFIGKNVVGVFYTYDMLFLNVHKFDCLDTNEHIISIQIRSFKSEKRSTKCVQKVEKTKGSLWSVENSLYQDGLLLSGSGKQIKIWSY